MLVSIVVPTYNEGENPRRVVATLQRVLRGLDFEVIFVDDSRSQESIAALKALESEHSFVRLLHRNYEKGLGTAVVRGFEMARGELMAVMDADMQHPPEVLRAMVREAQRGADIVIPSRFVPGGDDGGLSPSRKFISWGARVIGQIALKRVRKVTDPTSGFFLVRRSVVEGVELQPIGWKILIEVLMRGHYDRIVEIPYRFAPRAAGSSNMSFSQQLHYMHHIVKLLLESPEDRRKYIFAGVGIVGVFVNMLVYLLLLRTNIQLWQAGCLSALVAMFCNFVLNDRITWRDVPRAPALARLSKYAAVSIVGIAINTGVLALLEYRLDAHYFTSNLIGILVAMLWSYYGNNNWTWRAERTKIEVLFSHGTQDPDIRNA